MTLDEWIALSEEERGSIVRDWSPLKSGSNNAENGGPDTRSIEWLSVTEKIRRLRSIR